MSSNTPVFLQKRLLNDPEVECLPELKCHTTEDSPWGTCLPVVATNPRGISGAELKTWLRNIILCAALPKSDESRKGSGAVHFLLLSGGTSYPVFNQTALALLPSTMAGHSLQCNCSA